MVSRGPFRVQPGASTGLSLVEVLVALAILATVALALVGLQVAGLRATRTVAQTRHLAAAVRHETDLARVILAAGASCQQVPAEGSCSLSSECLDPVPQVDGCLLRRLTVDLSTPGGRRVTATTVGFALLETAPVLEPVAVEPP